MESTDKSISRQSSEEEISESRALCEQVDSDSSDSSSSTSTLVSEQQLDYSGVDSMIDTVDAIPTLVPGGYQDSSIGTSDSSHPPSGGSMGTLPDVDSLALDVANLLSSGAATNCPLGRTLSGTEKESAESVKILSSKKKQVPKIPLNEDLPSISQNELMEQDDVFEGGGESMSDAPETVSD